MLDDVWYFLLLDGPGLAVKLVQILDHCDEDDVAEGHKVNRSKVLHQVAACVDVDVEKQYEAENVPYQFEGQEHHLNNRQDPPFVRKPQQDSQHYDVIDEG